MCEEIEERTNRIVQFEKEREVKIKLDKLDVGIIVNALDKTKYELTEYTLEDVNTVLLNWIVVYENMIKQKEKIIIAELEYPVVLQALNLFRNKLINDTSKREILDKLIIKLAK